MNVKITKEQHEYLCTLNYKQYLFGSQLHGIANENSDFDYLRIINNSFYDNFKSLAIYLPNIHSFQFDNGKEQYVWLTEVQFYQNLFSGDGNMYADIVLFSNEFTNPLFLCRTFKVIKGYLGVCVRDLKLHGNNKKKVFHATRSLYMAEKLINNELPLVTEIKQLHRDFEFNSTTKEKLEMKEKELRKILVDMFNKQEIFLYPLFKEDNDLVQIIVNSNNIVNFKYD